MAGLGRYAARDMQFLAHEIRAQKEACMHDDPFDICRFRCHMLLTDGSGAGHSGTVRQTIAGNNLQLAKLGNKLDLAVGHSGSW